MKVRQDGVLPSSEIYIHMPSDFARSALYYVEMAGDYQCNAHYGINRDFFDMFMLFWIRSGTMRFETPTRNFIAETNAVIMLDCTEPHEFRADPSVDWLWMHVNGCSCRQYYELLRENGSMTQHNAAVPEISTYFRQVLAEVGRPPVNEHHISACVHNILSGLAAPQDGLQADDPVVLEAIRFIDGHYGEELSLERIAAAVGLSPSYFSRPFKQATNFSPYDYLLNTRIKQAKQLLLETRASAESVAVTCGFNSLSNFIRAFKKSTQLTPTQFRQMRF